MKEFYVMNLDLRRIALLTGGALTVLGLALFIGMAIGRGQGERNARIATEEAQQQKLGLPASESADKLVLASGPSETDASPSRATRRSGDRKQAEAAPAIPSVPEVKSEIPLREDPLVAGPPKKKSAAKKAAKAARRSDADDDAAEKPARKKRAVAKAKSREEPEVSGRVEHKSGRRKRSALSEDADEQLTAVAGTSRAEKVNSARYTIQVAAFKRASEANTLIEKLKGEGIKAHSQHSGDFYFVTVGHTKSKSKLEKALTRLKELEYDAYIRKLSGPTDET